MPPVVIIFGIPVLIAGVIALCYYLFYVRNTTGKGAAKRTERFLRRFAATRRFRVLSNLRFFHKDKEYVIENMLIGSFGILLVHTLGGRGSYYGSTDGKEWQRVLEKEKERAVFANPIKAQEEAIGGLRGIFAQHKVYSVPIEQVVAMTDKSRKTALYISNSQILLPGKLKPLLHKTKYENDAGVDIDRVIAAIEQHKIG